MPPDLAKAPLDAIVRALFDTSWGKARTWISTGKIAVDGVSVTDPLRRPGPRAKISLRMAAPKPRKEGELPFEAVVHVDTHLVVVNKPAGVSTIPYDEGERGTLDERIRQYLATRFRDARDAGAGARPSLGVVHRLDKETSGLIVFTRTWLAKQSLSGQFRVHSVDRRYLAIVHGHPESQTFRSHIVADRGDGLRGSLEAMQNRRSQGRGEGQRAVTHVRVVERVGPATLVECRLETGRTHQIRIHLSEAGHPLLGERVYIRRFNLPEIPAPRLMLHSAHLGLIHPKTSALVEFELPLPDDMKAVLSRLRLSPTT